MSPRRLLRPAVFWPASALRQPRPWPPCFRAKFPSPVGDLPSPAAPLAAIAMRLAVNTTSFRDHFFGSFYRYRPRGARHSNRQYFRLDLARDGRNIMGLRLGKGPPRRWTRQHDKAKALARHQRNCFISSDTGCAASLSRPLLATPTLARAASPRVFLFPSPALAVPLPQPVLPRLASLLTCSILHFAAVPPPGRCVFGWVAASCRVHSHAARRKSVDFFSAGTGLPG